MELGPELPVAGVGGAGLLRPGVRQVLLGALVERGEHGGGRAVVRLDVPRGLRLAGRQQLRLDDTGAEQLLRHDQEHGTSTTGDIPLLENGCTDSDRDTVRAYARRKWITTQERSPGS